MFAIGIRYLNGWSMAASDGARKEQAEWPPHPDRVFMALAAAWFETGEDPEEGEALRWLETLPPPAIAASDAAHRTAVTSYVPVNDNCSPINDKKKPPQPHAEGSLPIGRDRQARGFPVAIPHDPTMRLIWRETEFEAHRPALERLAAKVTHVGHSASFVQAWVEEASDVTVKWEPTGGIAKHRLRVSSPGRLERLAQPYRQAWSAYRGRLEEIEQAEIEFKAMTPPPRAAWRGFPDAVLLADELRSKRHADYPAAKSGDPVAAANLVDTLIDDRGIAAVRTLMAHVGERGILVLVSAHAYEDKGVNAIPAALAQWLSERLDLEYNDAVVQTNVVSHTGADGYGRLARQARFEGDVEQGREHLLVDDFIGQGGTLANLRGWIKKQGGTVVGAVGLTGKPYSAKLTPSREQLHELTQKHGRDFEKWWKTRFGHAFNCLTQSEARYLARSPDVDTIRDRLATAERRGNSRSGPRSLREQRRHVETLKANLKPATPRRPVPGRWQGYAAPQSKDAKSAPGSLFDPRLVVFGMQGRRLSLPTTLRLTAALRGLLMRECPEQPPPEWFSGHRPDGRATSVPHLALIPLSFVGSQHADGRVMGLALVFPRALPPQEVGRCLEPILRDSDTGLPHAHRLFSGDGFECVVELETRERPPTNLDPDTWTQVSRVWASVTPVVLNRHFDGKDKWERATDSVKDMCEHIGLPRPRDVVLHPVSLVEGVPHAREFPQLTRKHDGGRQSHSHAVLVFDEPVGGPVLIGAGRFRGYGLCRPMQRGAIRPRPR